MYHARSIFLVQYSLFDIHPRAPRAEFFLNVIEVGEGCFEAVQEVWHCVLAPLETVLQYVFGSWTARQGEDSGDPCQGEGGYSALKASTRLTRVARTAGTMHASNPTRVKVTTIAAYTVGSLGFTWKRAT